MYIYGAGGHAKVIIDILHQIGCPVEGIYDDDPATALRNGPYPFLERWVDRYDPEKQCIIAIGECAVRHKIATRAGLNWGTAVDPSASVADSARIGAGSVVMRGVCVNPDATIGEHVILNTHCSIDHDCRIEDFVHIAPMVGLCGNVQVGEGTLIGVGACVLPGIRIGRWVTVGAGAVVTRDVPDYAIVAGNPAQKIG